jgi:DNA polymerase III delta prime subunit
MSTEHSTAKETRMLGRNSTPHELIYGPTGSGKTQAVRHELAAEITAEHTETWIVDPHITVPEYANVADAYAATGSDIEALLVKLAREALSRTERMAALNLTEFTPGDPRHGLPLVAVTIVAAADVLVDQRHRSLVERTLRVSGKTGIKFRLVVPKPQIGWFGGSEVIRSSVANGRVLECERATA